MKKQTIFKKRKGAALMWMLIAFTVLMVLMTSIVFVVRQDIFETVKQEERLQTYYIALAGIDLTYSALMDPGHDPKKIKLAISELKKPGISELADKNITIDIGEKKRGTASVTIDRIKEDDVYWIRITSIGQLEDKDTKVSSTMRINESNTNQVIRESINK